MPGSSALTRASNLSNSKILIPKRLKVVFESCLHICQGATKLSLDHQFEVFAARSCGARSGAHIRSFADSRSEHPRPLFATHAPQAMFAGPSAQGNRG